MRQLQRIVGRFRLYQRYTHLNSRRYHLNQIKYFSASYEPGQSQKQFESEIPKKTGLEKDNLLEDVYKECLKSPVNEMLENLNYKYLPFLIKDIYKQEAKARNNFLKRLVKASCTPNFTLVNTPNFLLSSLVYHKACVKARLNSGAIFDIKQIFRHDTSALAHFVSSDLDEDFLTYLHYRDLLTNSQGKGKTFNIFLDYFVSSLDNMYSVFGSKLKLHFLIYNVDFISVYHKKIILNKILSESENILTKIPEKSIFHFIQLIRGLNSEELTDLFKNKLNEYNLEKDLTTFPLSELYKENNLEYIGCLITKCRDERKLNYILSLLLNDKLIITTQIVDKERVTLFLHYLLKIVKISKIKRKEKIKISDHNIVKLHNLIESKFYIFLLSHDITSKFGKCIENLEPKSTIQKRIYSTIVYKCNKEKYLKDENYIKILNLILLTQIKQKYIPVKHIISLLRTTKYVKENKISTYFKKKYLINKHNLKYVENKRELLKFFVDNKNIIHNLLLSFPGRGDNFLRTLIEMIREDIKEQDNHEVKRTLDEQCDAVSEEISEVKSRNQLTAN